MICEASFPAGCKSPVIAERLWGVGEFPRLWLELGTPDDSIPGYPGVSAFGCTFFSWFFIWICVSRFIVVVVDQNVSMQVWSKLFTM
jgi:hypothetical protein